MDALNIAYQTLLECPICLERFKPPVQTCENGHGVCQGCRQKLEFCGICRSPFTEIRNTLLNQVIESVITKCKYNAQGCDENFPISTVENHEKFCYFRKDKCSICRKEIYLQKLNDHFKDIHKSNIQQAEVNFATFFPITCRVYDTNRTLYYNLFVKNVQTYFLLRLYYMENRIILFCVQYVGKKQEEAKKYKYDLKIDQGLSLPNQSYFTCSGLCIPYIYDDKQTKAQGRVIELHLKSIFLTDKYLSGFKLNIQIKPLV